MDQGDEPLTVRILSKVAPFSERRENLKKLSFEIENAEIKATSNSQFAHARIHAFSSNKNRHDMICTDDVLRATATSIYNTPILYSINKVFNDFDSHSDEGDSLIAGFVVPESAQFERLEDGRLGLFVEAKIWKRYAPVAMELLKNSSGKKSVSVEMDLLESEKRDDGLVDMLNFEYTGICILGDFVKEASPGANIEMVSFAVEQEEYNKAYAMEFATYESLSFKIPDGAKKNAQRGLENRKQFGKGTSMGVTTAKYLIKNDTATPEKVRYIAQYFAKHSKDADGTNIGWELMGGHAAWRWSKKLVEQMDELDLRKMSYFEVKVTMPYKNIEDANAALRGIDPPITVGQANEIASVADSIGVSEDKNGWAIAISQFKESHTVKDGRWVKKEKNAKEEMAMEDEKAKAGVSEEAVMPKTEMSVDETGPKEEMATEKEEPKDAPAGEDKQDEKDEKEKEFSLDANIDVPAMLAMLQEETEDYAALAKEFSKTEDGPNFAMAITYMLGRFARMSEEMQKIDAENKAYMESNAQLQAFKANVEAKEFAATVEGTLNEIASSVEMPQEVVDALREESKSFSLETIAGWQNAAKAKAFQFAVKGKRNDEPDVVRVALSWGKPSTNDGSQVVWRR
jgi:hypothetical protein